MSKRRFSRKTLANVGLAALAAVTAGVVGFAVMEDPAQSPAVVARSPVVTVKPTAAQPAYPLLADVAPALKQAGQRMVVAVLGDSTGNGPDEWVRLSVDAIVQQTGRTVSLSTWNPDAGAYAPAEVIGPGEPDLIVWNGSASGKRPLYASENLPAMLPEKSDIVILNFGHNNGNAVEARTQVGNLIGQIRSGASNGAAMATTIQNPRLDKYKDSAALVVDGLRTQTGLFPELAVIDVNTAFKAAGDLPSLLLPDGLHPSPAGSQIWAQTVLNVLGF